MSVELYVYLAPNRVPSPQQWQDAVTQHGFSLRMDTAFDMLSSCGYRPCSFAEKPAGFEYYYEVLDRNALTEMGLSADKTIQITLVTHSDEREFLGSGIASAVLASLADGTLVDPQEGTELSGAEAIAWARNLEKDILVHALDDLAQEPPPRPPSSVRLRLACVFGVIMVIAGIGELAVGLANSGDELLRNMRLAGVLTIVGGVAILVLSAGKRLD